MRRLSLLLLLLLVGLIGWQLYVNHLLLRGAFGWDEAAHALKGALIADDLQQGDWLAFLYDSYRQVLWPPLHSWFLAVAFLLFGPSTVSAGAVSLVAFLLTALILYAIALHLDTRAGPLIGLLAAIFWLSALPLIQFATLAMLELPGLFALSIGILVHFQVNQADQPPQRQIWLALAIAFIYFLRTHYGVLFAIVVAIEWLMASGLRPTRLFMQRTLYLVLPLLLVFGLWFAYPPKLTATWTWLINIPDGVAEPYSAEGWLFYPRAFVRLAVSPWLFALFLVTYLAAWRNWRDRRARLLLLLVLVQFALGMFHQNKQDRYLFPLLPPLYLLAASGLVRWQAAWRLPPSHLSIGMAKLLNIGFLRAQVPRLVMLGATFVAITVLPNALQPLPAAPPADPLLATLVAQVSKSENTLLLGTTDVLYPHPPLIDWELLTHQQLITAPHAGSALQLEEATKLAALTTKLPLPAQLRERLLALFQRYAGAGARTLFLGLPQRAVYSQEAEAFYALLAQQVNDQHIDRVIVITSLADRARYPLAWIEPGLQRLQLAGGCD